LKIPRDLSADELVKSLRKLGYIVTRQKGSHIRLTTQINKGLHHITIPNHNPIKIGTLNNIINDLVSIHKIPKDEVITLIGGK
jgi:predicted RNA binding protein YcfA (HicA-like mRNA interferase family)